MPDRAPPIDGNRGRLQRPPTTNGYRVATFADVVKRHGHTMGMLAAIGLALPGSWNLVAATIGRGTEHAVTYLIGLAGMGLFFAYWSTRQGYPASRQARWIVYLLFISVVEV